MWGRYLLPLLAVAFAWDVHPASAQKSQDTLRTALGAPIETVDLLLDPKPENALLTRSVYDGLVAYDERAKTFKPLLAKSWVAGANPFAFEFELRDDVKWHDGEKFDADDVVYMIGWLIDPKTKLRFKRDYEWIERVEKLGPHKVRIVGKEPFAPALLRMAYSMHIYPEHVHAALQEKSDFGRAPVGSGPYRVTQLDKNKGIVVERHEPFAHGGDWKTKSNIKRWSLLPIPDAGAQTAQMLVGNLDMIRASDEDQAKDFSARPGIALTHTQGLSYTYILLDATGRSGVKALADPRVRKAILMAIDRAELAKLDGAPAGGERLEALCFRSQQGCGYSAMPPHFDLAGAKRLLADAGYPGGFDLEVTTFTLRTGTIGQAVANQLRALGLRTNVDVKTIEAYQKKMRDGKIQVLVGGWSQGGVPDPQGTIRLFANRVGDPDDYFADAELEALADASNSLLDDAERRRVVGRLFDRLTENAYVVPLISSSQIFIHSRDVAMETGSYNPYGADLSDFRWK